MRMRVAIGGLAAVMLLAFAGTCLAQDTQDPRHRAITIRLRDVSLRAALDMLLRETGLTYQLPRDIEAEQVTVDLKELPLEQALHAIVTAQGLTYRYLPDARLYIIEPLPEPAPAETPTPVTLPEPEPGPSETVTPPTVTPLPTIEPGEIVTRVIAIRYGDAATIAQAFGGQVAPHRLQNLYAYPRFGVYGGYGSGYTGYNPYGMRGSFFGQYSSPYDYGGGYGWPYGGGYSTYGPYGGYGVGYGGYNGYTGYPYP